MQHIVNVAFDFDDEKVRETAEKAVDQDLQKIVKEIVLDKVAPMDSGWYGAPRRNWDKLNKLLDAELRALLEEHREAIIEHAASKLVENIRKSKAWKEKYGEVTDG